VARFEYLWPGSYYPLFRLKAKPEMKNQAKFIQLVVSIDEEEIYSLKLDSVLKEFGDSWVIVKLPKVNVGKFRQTVNVVMHDTDTSRYKSGLTIDYFSMATEKSKAAVKESKEQKGELNPIELIESALRIFGL
jgi:hypothetical protein